MFQCRQAAAEFCRVAVEGDDDGHKRLHMQCGDTCAGGQDSAPAGSFLGV